MKYVLVNKQDEIEWSQDLASNIGISGAKTYFRGVKQIDEKGVTYTIEEFTDVVTQLKMRRKNA